MSNEGRKPVWHQYLSERDRQIFEKSGYGTMGGFGKRPALLVIDVNWAFCGDKPEPILDSIARWPNSCGEDAWIALPFIRSLIDACHRKAIPVIYTTVGFRDDKWDWGGWLWKNKRIEGDAPVPANGLDPNEIVTPIAPAPQDLVIVKQKASAFFGTNLSSYLTLLGCDSVIVVGTTTSGCVRATVVDASSYNYRVVIAEEACFDRSEVSHAINLMDMNAKYADVRQTADIVTYIQALPANLFQLPKGPPMKSAAE